MPKRATPLRDRATTRYPIYIPTKGRVTCCKTAELFLKEHIEFYLVVEPQEAEVYAARYGAERLRLLPQNNGGLVYSRNWIKEYATGQGHERHWQFDDDIAYFSRRYRGLRIRCDASAALEAAEDFADRYENVALLSFNSEFFLPDNKKFPPFYLNSRCYTVFLINDAIPYRFRGRYNEDTDMSLQVLAGGWCTILFNAFMIKTDTTMTAGGGNTTIYVDDGRLRMARSLERVWPGVVTTYRRFRRAQHHVKGLWQYFDTPLRLKPGVVLPDQPDEYGLRPVAVRTVRDPDLEEILAQPPQAARKPKRS